MEISGISGTSTNVYKVTNCRRSFFLTRYTRSCPAFTCSSKIMCLQSSVRMPHDYRNFHLSMEFDHSNPTSPHLNIRYIWGYTQSSAKKRNRTTGNTPELWNALQEVRCTFPFIFNIIAYSIFLEVRGIHAPSYFCSPLLRIYQGRCARFLALECM